MPLKNAQEASKIVRDFLADMGWTIYVYPRKAERSGKYWVIVFTVGARDMMFEVDAESGEVVRYSTEN